MNILFITGLFPIEIKESIITGNKGIIEFAADTLQWNIINGIESNISNSLTIINAPFVGSYPRLHYKWRISGCRFSHNFVANDISVTFINIRPFKYFDIKYKISDELRKRIVFDDENVILIYSSNTSFMNAALKIKNEYPSVKICLILPDLPMFMSNNDNLYYKLRHIQSQNNLNKKLNKIDCFVLLTKGMVRYLHIESKPYTVIEGMIDCSSLPKEKFENQNDIKIILYTGTLAKRYGIITLLNAFKKINEPSFRLWICGTGDAKSEVLDFQNNDPRVKYWGQIPREEILELQNNATLLINPRSSKDEYTKYSFPSKTLEYMFSGTPVLMNKLPGISEEYYKYIYTYNETAESLAKNIKLICDQNKGILISFGNKAKKFVLENKNPQNQCLKILDLIYSL